MAFAAVGDYAFSSDIVAWNETLGGALCTDNVILPVGDIRWGQCFTSGAFQTCTREVGGSGLFSDLLVGEQLWIVARCLDDVHPSFSKVGLFSTVRDIFTFEQDPHHRRRWYFEAIYLRAGTRMCVLSSSSTSCESCTFLFSVLQPNTPYFLFTAQHAICHAGSFYATSTMQDTFYGIIINFVADPVSDIPQHRTSRRLLRRMIMFYHLALVKGGVENTRG